MFNEISWRLFFFFYQSQKLFSNGIHSYTKDIFSYIDIENILMAICFLDKYDIILFFIKKYVFIFNEIISICNNNDIANQI